MGAVPAEVRCVESVTGREIITVLAKGGTISAE
jgi:hypothetical protein